MSNKLHKKSLKQAENQNQQGRSMVEMLGVLAIIGVLSIGAIRGYRWAMDKHIANQILYEMNLNSAQLAMLLQRGDRNGVTLSLGSPYDDGTFKGVDYGFDYGCGEGEADEADDYKCYPDETGYYIQAKKLPESVADMVADSAKNLQYYLDFDISETSDGENEKTITMFFDVNANEDEEDSDSEVVPTTTTPETTTLKPTRPPQTVPTTATTPETTTLETTTLKPTRPPHSVPVSTATTTLTTQSLTTLTTNAATTLTTNAATTAYETTGDVGECAENADCQALKGNNNYYCYFNYSDNCTIQTGYAGTCERKSPDGTITINEGQDNEKKFIAKNEDMSWWSAQNFCYANGKELASISDLDCANTIKGVGNYCYQEDGKTISSAITALKGKFGSHWFWLSDMYDTSCTAYGVSFSDGHIDRGSRLNSTYYGHFAYALCVDKEE